jgi:hypothetical protein
MRSLGSPSRRTRSSSRTDAAAGSTFASSAASTGGQRRSGPASSRCAGLRPAPHLRHLRAPRRYSGIRVSRFMGSSIAMIDRHYGHLARDSREHASFLSPHPATKGHDQQQLREAPRGLEPRTPSLPSGRGGLQAFRLCLSAASCTRVPSAGSAGLHRRSIFGRLKRTITAVVASKP